MRTARTICIETCEYSTSLYEKGNEYTISMPKDHTHWQYFTVVEDITPAEEQATGKKG